MTTIRIIAEKCSRCGACVHSCPQWVMRIGEDGPAFVVNEDLCIACGHCAAVCPAEAVIHPVAAPDTLIPVNSCALSSPESFMELLKKRRTYRSFLAKSVERMKIETILEAAGNAPSAHNTRSTQFVVVTDDAILRSVRSAVVGYYKEILRMMDTPISRFFMGRVMGGDIRNVIREIRDVLEFHEEGRDAVLYGAPCLIILHARKSPRYPDLNAQLALQNALLMAESLGLGAFVAGYALMAFSRRKNLARIVGIQEGHAVHGALGVGYPRFPFSRRMTLASPSATWLL